MQGMTSKLRLRFVDWRRHIFGLDQDYNRRLEALDLQHGSVRDLLEHFGTEQFDAACAGYKIYKNLFLAIVKCEVM